MRNSYSIPVVLLAAAVVFTGACSARRQPKVPGVVFSPPATEPDAAGQSPEAKPPAPSPITEPPPDPMVGTKPSVSDTTPPLAPEPATVAPPPEEVPQPKPQTASKPAPRQADESAPQGPVAVPQLTQLLTDEEEWTYNREIDDILVKVNETITLLSQRSLNEEQMVELDRVRAFVKQTIDLRQDDLVSALNLARRTELLATDLAHSSR